MDLLLQANEGALRGGGKSHASPPSAVHNTILRGLVTCQARAIVATAPHQRAGGDFCADPQNLRVILFPWAIRDSPWTSSFTVVGWEGPFYPKGTRPADFLALYGELCAD